jgi:hypothetical protein
MNPNPKVYSLTNNKWKAITIQAEPIYGLNLSPIRLAFQQIPFIPICLLLFVGSSLAALLNTPGHKLLECVVRQINNSITTKREGKSNRALLKCKKKTLKFGFIDINYVFYLPFGC